MNVFEAVVLGTVQGLTEFLPISSSGHLRIVPAIAGWDDPGAAFTAVIQFGTMLAVLLYFRRDIAAITSTWTRSLFNKDLRSDVNARMGWFVIAGTVPIGICGIAFKDQIETTARDLRLISVMLIVLGLVLLFAEKVGRRERTLEQTTWKDALVVGGAQALALIPGSSRSGTTITAGLFLGLTREAAARFSFLLSIPAIVASGLYTLPDIGKTVEGQEPIGWTPTLIATVVSFVVGYASIAWLLKWLTSHSTFVFSAYRVVVGLGVLGLLAFNVVDANG